MQIEDLTGSCEAVVFPKSYERLSDHLMTESRLLLWATVDRRDERVQLIVDDCRTIDDLRLLLVDLLPEEASDIEVQNRLRECLYKHRPGKDELGIKVPVIAAIRQCENVRYVKLGNQFCVGDPNAAINSLQSKSFKASYSEYLVA